MLYDNIDYTQLIRFSKDGLIIASYTDVRAAITKRYKQIYGQDVDLSTGTADGQFIEMMSLMVHNILNSVKSMYVGLDPNYAQGKFLDMICSLSNVERKQASYSTASITVTNTSNEAWSSNDLNVIDKAGTLWSYSGELNIAANSSTSIVVTCSQLGAIKAEAGWIYKTAENTPLTITQSNDAIVGQMLESDEHLRARRNNSLAMTGLTSLESLNSSLLSIDGIEDVYIYNVTQSGQTAKDSTSLTLHSIYVCLRKNANIGNISSQIGTIIYEKSTPGIPTIETSDSTTGTSKSYNYDTGTSIQQTVYWKECTPVHPTITITITPRDYYTTDTRQVIKDKIASYCNNLHISTNLVIEDLFAQTMYADPTFRGLATYLVQSVAIAGLAEGANTYVNTDTYYDYSSANITVVDGRS